MSIKEKIVEGINKAKSQGYTLVTEDWGNSDDKCACALGCLLVTTDHGICDDAEHNGEEAAHILGVSETWINSFIEGFDGGTPNTNADEHFEEAYQIGKQLREEMRPMDHSTFVQMKDEDAAELDDDDHYY